jgi:hypothetical protein
MKYLLSIYGSEQAWDALTADDIADRDRVHGEVIRDLRASGELIDTRQLDDGGVVVRTTAGVPAVTDGPFTEAREIVGGFYLVDVASQERAVEIAARFTEAEYAPIEVRPLVEHDD